MNEISQSILKTLIYFDLHDYPLTLMEIWKWLYTERHGALLAGTAGSVMDIERTLGQLSDKIGSKDGFYFLSGRQALVKLRLARYNISEQKFKRARKFIRIIRLIPFVRCVMVVNRLAYGNVHQDSDVDLAVIVQKNRLWLTRLLLIGWVSLLRVRPKQIARSQAIDLSFFISEDSLNLLSLKYPQDVLFPFWVNQFVPVYDDGIFKDFIKANQWVKTYLPNAFPYRLNERRQVGESQLVKRVMRFIGDWDFWEKLAKSYQLKIMPQDLKAMMNQDSRVVVNEKFLKFHRHDSRRAVQEKFDESVSRLVG